MLVLKTAIKLLALILNNVDNYLFHIMAQYTYIHIEVYIFIQNLTITALLTWPLATQSRLLYSFINLNVTKNHSYFKARIE